jgi:hypothetical protein
MLYYNQPFQLENTKYPRFLFSDIFLTDKTIGIISIIYPDVEQKYSDIECKISGLDTIFRFNKKIMREKYESNVYAYIDDDNLKKFIKNNNKLDLTITYQNITKNYQIQKIHNKKYNLALSTLFKDDYYLLLSWIEYYMLLGVEHFFLYYNKKIDTKMTNIIKKYIDNDIVTIIEWDFVHKLPEIQKLDPNLILVKDSYKNNYHHSQPMSMSHCLNYYGTKCKWLGFLDLDEYIVTTKYLKLNDILNKYEYNKTAAIKFYCMWADLDGVDFRNDLIKNSYHVFNNYNTIRKLESEGTFYRTKCIVNPNNINICGVHRVKDYDNKKYTEHLLDENDAYFLHYYKFSGGWGGRDKRDPLRSNQKILDNQINKMIKYNNIF